MLFVCHSKILHKHCLQFLLGVKISPRETENNAYAKSWGYKQRALWYVVVFSGVVNSRSRNCLCTAHARQGGNSVWQMGKSVFFVTFAQSMTFEFSACLERRLLKRRTTVALSDLASRTLQAGVEPILNNQLISANVVPLMRLFQN